MAGGKLFPVVRRNPLFASGKRQMLPHEQDRLCLSQTLKRPGVRILAEEVGGNRGRIMIPDSAAGQVFSRTVGSPLK